MHCTNLLLVTYTAILLQGYATAPSNEKFDSPNGTWRTTI